MKVNGTRVEDLAGTGLVTKQRYVLPLSVTVPLFLGKHLARGLWWAAVHAVRAWTLTGPALVLLVVYVRAGWLGVLTTLMWTMAGGLVWARRWPASFSRLVGQRARGAWRWQSTYRRR